jgi:flagellin-like hook-associated protein FlgL
MREISVQAANDTNNAQDRQNLQAEMDALSTEIDRIAGTTTWAGEKLMESETGSFFSFQVGAATGGKKPDRRHDRWHGCKYSRFLNYCAECKFCILYT